MKKILFIIQWHHIPSKLANSANAICDERVIDELKKNKDFEIHTLSYGLNGYPMEDKIDNIYIHRFKRPKWWNRFIYSRNKPKSVLDKAVYLFDKLSLRFKQLSLIPIYPNITPFHSWKVAREAIKLHKKHNFDAVICEHNGRDTTYAAYKLKSKFPEIIFIPILWDPMSGKELAKYLPQKFAARRYDKDEHKILSKADLIIELQSNKEYQEKHSKSKIFYNKIKFLDIPGIVKTNCEDNQNHYTKEGYINILYSGLISLPDRDPSVLIDIINGSKYADKINLLFFAAGRPGIVKTEHKLENFKGDWTVSPFIPKDELNMVADSCDILLNIGGPNPTMVPSKIFEYMSLCKPVISTYYIDNETSKSYFKKYPLALCIDLRKTIEENIRLFENFIETKIHLSISFEEVEQMFPLNSPKGFRKEIEQIING